MRQCDLNMKAAAVLLILSIPAIAGELETVKERVDADGAETLDIKCEFAIGEFVIKGQDMPDAAELEVTYTPEWIDYDVDFHKRANTGLLTLESRMRRRRISDEAENEWQLTLSTRYPMRLEFELGACEADFDLGGLPITALLVEAGATSGHLDFSKPNPARLSELTIEAGASSLELVNLGNANFEEMHFEGGAASCELDFHGDFSGEALVELEIGLGSLDVVIPRGLAIRVESDESWFSSVDFHGMQLEEVDDDVYESADFVGADNRLIFEVSVGMGSVDFHGKK